MNYEYVKFRVTNPKRFDMLKQVFDKLKTDKEQGAIESEDRYLSFFDEEAQGYFWWHENEEHEDCVKRRIAHPVTWTLPDEYGCWIFGSMIGAFSDGEYLFVDCKLLHESIGILEIDAWAYPYGGIGAIIALVECFGHKVIETWDCASPPRFLE